MDVKVYVGVEQALQAVLVQLASMEAKVDTLMQKVEQLTFKEEKIMATIDDVLAGVTQESSVADSLVALSNNLHQLYLDALAGVTLPPAVQAKLDAINTTVQADKAKMAAVVTANTPPPPAP